MTSTQKVFDRDKLEEWKSQEFLNTDYICHWCLKDVRDKSITVCHSYEDGSLVFRNHHKIVQKTKEGLAVLFVYAKEFEIIQERY